MKTENIVQFWLVVLLVIIMLPSVLSDDSLIDSSCVLSDPEIVDSPNPTLVVDFDPDNEGYEYIDETVEVVFRDYGESEELDVEEYDDISDQIIIIEDRSNASAIYYELQDDLVNGKYYVVAVYAQSYMDTEDGEEEIVELTRCSPYEADFASLSAEPKGSYDDDGSTYVTDPDETIYFETSRRATCYIVEAGEDQEFENTGGVYEHSTTHPGYDDFTVRCVAEDDGEEIEEDFSIPIDTEPPSLPRIGITSAERMDPLPIIVASTEEIFIMISSEDDVSGVDYINYTIKSEESGTNITRWRTRKELDDGTFNVLIEGNPLFEVLQNYYVEAYAVNNAGLESERNQSDIFRVNEMYVPDDGSDPIECDEDGENCETGEWCEHDNECASGFCNPDLDRCMTPSCSDGFQSGEQTDVDCGGPNCGKCIVERSCREHDDCVTQYCEKEDDGDEFGVCEVFDEEDSDDDSADEDDDSADEEDPGDETDYEEDDPFDDLEPSDDPDEENNFLVPVLIVLLSVGLLGGGGYYAYRQYATKKASPPPMPQPNSNSTFKSIKGDKGLEDENKKTKTPKENAKELSYRMKKKEEERKRKQVFQGFSQAEAKRTDSEEAEKKDMVTKDDIEGLFGGSE